MSIATVGANQLTLNPNSAHPTHYTINHSLKTAVVSEHVIHITQLSVQFTDNRLNAFIY